MAAIYHNPDCGTSRNEPAKIRQSGAGPEVILHLETPTSREPIDRLIAAMEIAPRDLLCRKRTPDDALGPDDPGPINAEPIDVMMAHPVMINRPTAVEPKGTHLCQPSEVVVVR